MESYVERWKREKAQESARAQKKTKSKKVSDDKKQVTTVTISQDADSMTNAGGESNEQNSRSEGQATQKEA